MIDCIHSMTVEADRSGWKLTVQMASGSFAQQFLPVDESPDVVFRLRRLAEFIDRGGIKPVRSTTRPDEL